MSVTNSAGVRSQPIAVDKTGNDLYLGDTVYYYGTRYVVVDRGLGPLLPVEIITIAPYQSAPYYSYYVVRSSNVSLCASLVLTRSQLN